MKYLLLLFILSWISCQERKPTLEERLEKISVKEYLANKAKQNDIETVFYDSISFDDSFIGKITPELDYNKFHDCWGTVLTSSRDSTGDYRMAVSAFAATKEDCRTGNTRIVFEKMLYRENRKAVFNIMDEIYVEKTKSHYYFDLIWLNLSGVEKEYLVAFRESEQPIITEIYSIWAIDLEHQQFKKVEIPKNFSFENPEYHGDMGY